MRFITKLACLPLAAGLVTGMAITASDAAPRCRGTISGSAASLGFLGIGSATARAAARVDWESKVASAYGARYANLNRASWVRWSCKPGFIMPATCVVVARPCRY